MLLVMSLIVGISSASPSGGIENCGELRAKDGGYIRSFHVVRSPDISCRTARRLTKRIENGARAGWNQSIET